MQMKTQQALRRSALVLAVVAALVGPQLALADDAHEKALEARVAELERIVNQLAAQQKTQQAAAPAPRAVQDTSGITKKHAETNPSPYVLAAEAPNQKPIQDTTITPGSSPNTTFHFQVGFSHQSSDTSTASPMHDVSAMSFVTRPACAITGGSAVNSSVL